MSFAGHMLAFVLGAFFMAAATIVVMGLIIRWHREGEHVIGVIDIPEVVFLTVHPSIQACPDARFGGRRS